MIQCLIFINEELIFNHEHFLMLILLISSLITLINSEDELPTYWSTLSLSPSLYSSSLSSFIVLYIPLNVSLYTIFMIALFYKIRYLQNNTSFIFIKTSSYLKNPECDLNINLMKEEKYCNDADLPM